MLASYLQSIQQETLLDQLSPIQQQNLLEDLSTFESTYRGGIGQYVANVRKLVNQGEITTEYAAVEVGCLAL